MDSVKNLILQQLLNDYFKKSMEDGSMKKCAETYKVQAALIEK